VLPNRDIAIVATEIPSEIIKYTSSVEIKRMKGILLARAVCTA